MKKPHKGSISSWKKLNVVNPDNAELINKFYGPSLGYVIRGIPSGHPEFENWIRTSLVVKHNKRTGEIETLNSRYKLVGKEQS